MEQEEINEMIEESEQNEPAFGHVNCKLLNVREAPDAESEVITVLHKGSEVMIDANLSTDEFYSVCTETGVEGFCMRQFIEV